MNEYQKTAKWFKNKIKNDIDLIYKLSSNELILELAKENLLELKDNCIESSTAIGYCIEEFIYKKLHRLDSNFYKRNNSSTQRSSYDLWVLKNKILILINLKVNKKNNNAIAALNQIYKDYCLSNPDQEKLFLIFKTNYKIKNKMIKIENTNCFYFEECKFNLIKTDNRRWSVKGGELSCRLQYNSNNKMNEIKDISYKDTFLKIKKLIKKRNS